MTPELSLSAPADEFVHRHIGPNDSDIQRMLDVVGVASLDALIDAAVPESIRDRSPLALDAPSPEAVVLQRAKELGARNQVYTSLIGMGYHGTITPPVIQRNLLENPGWYTAYTPYQPEISQGRLEALLNFQTMVSDLTGVEITNASLLDEGTAAAEAMAMLRRVSTSANESFLRRCGLSSTNHRGGAHQSRATRNQSRGWRSGARSREHRRLRSASAIPRFERSGT